MKHKIIDLYRPMLYRPKYNNSQPLSLRNRIKRLLKDLVCTCVDFASKMRFYLFPKNWLAWATVSLKYLDLTDCYLPNIGGIDHTALKWIKNVNPNQIPIELSLGHGKLIDCTHKANDGIITKADLQEALIHDNITIRYGDIVLIRTRKNNAIGSLENLINEVILSKEAMVWLLGQEIKVIGIDQYCSSIPNIVLANHVLNDWNLNFKPHTIDKESEFYILQQLTSLDLLPLSGFKVCVLPLSISDNSISPHRVVAILS